jgi:hypothetical protein
MLFKLAGCVMFGQRWVGLGRLFTSDALYTCALLCEQQQQLCLAAQVGHATVLVQMAGLTFITDPCFSER